MFDSIHRWRHTHGYGVHSPFSYEVVTRAIRPGRDYAWYGYRDISNTMGHLNDYRVEREAQMLLRLVSMLQPKVVFLPYGAHPAYHAAIKAGGNKIQILRKTSDIDECNLLCTNENFFTLKDLCRFLQKENNWIAVRNIPQEWVSYIYDRLPEGVVFVGKHNLLAIHRPGMQKQMYTLSI